jgi:hypothetical protein
MPSPDELPSPPRAPIAFRVGVVGHQPDRLPKTRRARGEISAVILSALSAVRNEVRAFAADTPGVYAQDEPRLLAISSLAEGGDRMFASVALDAGYALCVPMPFVQAEFEKDFGSPDGASVKEFRTLLARAATSGVLTRFELDGNREAAGDAYEAAARIVLNQSDLLIAIWDGGPSRGKGSSVDTIREAIKYHVPVIWIDTRSPHKCTLLRHMPEPDEPRRDEVRDERADAAALAKTIRTLVHEELAVPIDTSQPPLHGDKDQQDSNALAGEYFIEHRPAINVHVGWKMFRNLVAGSGSILPRLRTKDYVEEARAENDGPDDEELIAHFAWADKLADRYADAHRGGVIATSILSALAVFFGLLPVALGIEGGEHWLAELILILVELVVVVMLSRTISQAKKKHFHEKWLEYRMLAEWIRQLRFMVPLGGGRPLLRIREHLSVYGEPTRSWMYWHVRAIARARSLPSTVVDRAHVANCLDGITRTIDGQIGFHSATMDRSDRIQHRLHRVTKWIVRATIAAVLIHLAMKITQITCRRPLEIAFQRWLPGGLADVPERLVHAIAGLLLLCSAVLPAVGASIANINNQGEFARLGKRARAMRDSFLRLKPEADAMRARIAEPGASVSMALVTRLAGRMATTMLEEVVDWRVVVLDLPQGLE